MFFSFTEVCCNIGLSLLLIRFFFTEAARCSSVIVLLNDAHVYRLCVTYARVDYVHTCLPSEWKG